MKLSLCLALCVLAAMPMRLTTGDAVADRAFTSQRGQTVSLSEFKGRALALTFLFTRCPLPDYCPRLTNHFREVQRELMKLPQQADWHLLSLSFDPEHDTPAQLSAYAKAQGADAAHWTFATGPLAEVREFGAAFGLEVSTTDGLLNHNLRTVVVDAAGRVQCIFKGSDWTAQDLLWEMQKAMQVKP